ncbi:unnamed protein product [Adineta ricciae]|uniref:ADP ribosyltransferase domain-containing protein n=1 Tax=Adineta ricciae TaxID=249248 RepID=A0A815KD96_ADIRI|nr:unnamed protein product [Adineta ricciae]CAF1394152.1 unnamed protein product [Adineta ricciae]
MNGDEQRRRHNRQASEIAENLEDVTLIWLDSNVNETVDNYDTRTLLESLSNSVLVYTDPALCMDYIREITKEGILLVVSGMLSEVVLSQIHSLKTITAIFIFCSDRKKYVPMLKRYSKITDIFIDQDSLMRSVQKTMYFIRKQAMTFSLFDEQKQRSTHDVSKDFGSFTWFQLLIDILRKIPQTDRSKQDMLDKCREYYALNQIERRKIEQFELTYAPHKAIEWYTRDSFVYRLVNKALRTENPEIIYLFRFYILDLCTQLEHEWKRSKTETNGTLTVYRGQRMSAEECNKLTCSAGSMISTNGFFSTTKELDVALKFLESYSDNSKTVLFEIRVDPCLQTAVFANIDQFSFVEGEKEVLFSLGSVFKIDNIIYDSPFYSCKIQMTATDERSISIQEYLNAKRQQMNDYSPTILFGRLLFLELGQLDKGERYFRMLLKTLPPDHEDFASACNNLGNVFYGKRQLNLALECFVRAYLLRRRNSHGNYSGIGATLMNIGFVFNLQRRYDRALFYVERALKIFENNSLKDHQFAAMAINGLGLIYREREEYQISLEYLNQALKIYQRLLPSQHPDIASCLGNIGWIHEDLKDYDQALDFYCRAFAIDENILPANHPNLTDDSNRVIDIYRKKDEDHNAVEFCEKLLTKYQDNLLAANILKNLGDLTPNGTKRIEYYKQALVIFEQSLNSTELLIVYCLIDISRSYWECNMFDDALTYQLKALNKQQRISYGEQSELLLSFENTGRLYYNLQKWREAIDCFTKAKTILKFNTQFNQDCLDEMDNLIAIAKRNGSRCLSIK